MNITITEAATNKMNDRLSGHKGYVKLKYETEGCGCVVSGVPTLWVVSELDKVDDIIIETNHIPIVVEKSKVVFLDEELKIDYNDAYNAFQLKSPSQILNGRMSLQIKL